METLVALCGVGTEKVVANELRKLKLPIRDAGIGRVRFQADIPGCYRALLCLRAADRVLLEAANFPAGDFDALFEGIRAVDWERYIPPNRGIRITKVRIGKSRLQSVTGVQRAAHKAAAARLCERYHCSRLPEGDGAAELRVYLEKDQASVLLDISGEPLFKRGYRTEGGIAPLRETTAAALILLSAWRRKFPLYDPFCGSGAIIIEAALYAWDAAPGLGRRFALSELSLGDSGIEKSLREELLGRVDFSRPVRIYGSDADHRAIALAKSNMARAYALARGETLDQGILNPPALPCLPAIRVLRMEDAAAPAGIPAGFIITNPPYGKRLGALAEAEAVYRSMANIGRRFPGWKLALITDHPGFESHFGKRADSCREMTNGALDSYFYQYEGRVCP
ncbi:MAG: class I SAM-dependent RNA methyltransferase [Treponema sp.]|nr:class I SAM-dependent RNA methyltransferase [Treponema sp.]